MLFEAGDISDETKGAGERGVEHEGLGLSDGVEHGDEATAGQASEDGGIEAVPCLLLLLLLLLELLCKGRVVGLGWREGRAGDGAGRSCRRCGSGSSSSGHYVWDGSR